MTSTSSTRYDSALLADIKDRTDLVALIEGRVKLRGRGKWREGLCPFHSEKTPSFKVNTRKRYFRCFGCSQRGDAFRWLQLIEHLTFPEAVTQLANQAGVPLPSGTAAEQAATRQAAPLPPVEPPAEDEDVLERIAWARALFAKCLPPAGTLVETYFLARGIDWARMGGLPPTIRFAPDLWHPKAKRSFPGMVAAVQEPETGRIVGAHRTWFLLDGSGKADVSPKKMTAGRTWGCAIRLAPASERMVAGEGIETTASVMQATGLPGWVGISLDNLAGPGLGEGRAHPKPKTKGQRLPTIRPDMTATAFGPPPGCKDWTLLRDADCKDQIAADCLLERALRRAALLGVTARRASPPTGMDFNDLSRPDAPSAECASGVPA